MASESIVPHVVPEVSSLEWPRFCYAGPSAFEEDLAACTKKRARVVTPPAQQPRPQRMAPLSTPPPPKKRKASSDLRSSPETSAFERPSKVARQQSDGANVILQQTLSRNVFPFPGMAALTRPLISFTAAPPHPPPSEFAFSDLMKKMAAKYQQPEERLPTPPPQPSFANPFGLPPYFAHFLPTAASLQSVSNSDAESVADSNNSDSAAGSPTVPSSSSSVAAALDLSPKSVNVVDTVEDWSVDQVVAFVRSVEGCEEYAEIFREHTLEGSSLALLSESHLTGILGLKLGPAMRLLKAIRAL